MQSAGKLAMVLGTRTFLLNSNRRFPSSFTQINSSPLSSLQCQLHTDASSGMWRGCNFPMQQHPVQSTMSRTYFSTEAVSANANHAACKQTENAMKYVFNENISAEKSSCPCRKPYGCHCRC